MATSQTMPKYILSPKEVTTLWCTIPIFIVFLIFFVCMKAGLMACIMLAILVGSCAVLNTSKQLIALGNQPLTNAYAVSRKRYIYLKNVNCRSRVLKSFSCICYLKVKKSFMPTLKIKQWPSEKFKTNDPDVQAMDVIGEFPLDVLSNEIKVWLDEQTDFYLNACANELKDYPPAFYSIIDKFDISSDTVKNSRLYCQKLENPYVEF